MRAFPILALIALLLAASAAQAGELILARLCLPQTSRFTKCIGGRIASCTRSRNVKCKTHERCAPTGQSCDLPFLLR